MYPSSMYPSSSPRDELAHELISRAGQLGLTIAIAESLTGGLVCDALVRIPGASRVFRGGIVAYSSDVKQELLGVDREVLSTMGAIDAGVASAMALGVRLRLGSRIGLATTGVAGPEAQDEHPPGTVFIAADLEGHEPRVQRLDLTAGREENRQRTVTAVLELAVGRLRDITVRPG